MLMPITPVSLSFGAAVLLGLSFGAGPCNIACLPYLGPVFMATGDGVQKSWRILLHFSLGRMSGYALLGCAAGWIGLLVQEWINNPAVRWVLGGATILVAFSLLWRYYRNAKKPFGCSKNQPKTGIEVSLDQLQPQTTTMPGGLFFMGMGMALNPCGPLTMVVFGAATTASALSGLSLGIGFGLGAVVIPTIIFAFGVAHFGAQLREHVGRWRGPLELSSAGLLLFMGVFTGLGWISP